MAKTLYSRLSGSDIVVSRQADPEEPFVVAEVQVCLATVVQHKYFAVLERRHRAGVRVLRIMTVLCTYNTISGKAESVRGEGRVGGERRGK